MTILSIKIFIFCLISIGIIWSLYANTNKWAAILQKKYISEARKMYGNSCGWERLWILILFKVGIIFSSAVVTAIIFSFLFGTIYGSGCDAACQAAWESNTSGTY